MVTLEEKGTLFVALPTNQRGQCQPESTRDCKTLSFWLNKYFDWEYENMQRATFELDICLLESKSPPRTIHRALSISFSNTPLPLFSARRLRFQRHSNLTGQSSSSGNDANLPFLSSSQVSIKLDPILLSTGSSIEFSPLPELALWCHLDLFL
ncbi:hypothetical protein L6164_001295 [Bauhinia variegata]|uniref:Uncharacterized protein n=1 Tax=Bauhinia variegata TaxID=167791 RepID=A0ACB9QAG7_BAUVA|nr:hypothetical protein L6164_001295 [Bauhinia variegata]